MIDACLLDLNAGLAVDTRLASAARHPVRVAVGRKLSQVSEFVYAAILHEVYRATSLPEDRDA